MEERSIDPKRVGIGTLVVLALLLVLAAQFASWFAAQSETPAKYASASEEPYAPYSEPAEDPVDGVDGYDGLEEPPYPDDAAAVRAAGVSASGAVDSAGSGGRAAGATGTQSEGPDGATQPGDGETGPEPQDGDEPPAAPASGWISGTVAHEVWGTPLENVRVLLDGTRATVTDRAGGYRFGELPVGSAVVRAVAGSTWLSSGDLERRAAIMADRGGRADFRLYAVNEAYGTTSHSTGYWKNWRNHRTHAEMEELVAKVRAATSEFSALTIQDVSSIMSPSRGSGWGDRIARARFLAVWLDMAAGDLGFDVSVDVSRVAGSAPIAASAAPDGTTNVLDLARDIDRYLAGGGDPGFAERTIGACAKP